MRRLLLPFFIFRLGLALLPFLLQVAWLLLFPFLGLFMMIVVVFLYVLLFARNVMKLRFLEQQPPLPASTSLSPQSEKIQQKIVTGYDHKLWYRDDEELKTKQAQIHQLLLADPTHRDLLINAAILAEINPISEISTYDKARYSDPNSPLLAR